MAHMTPRQWVMRIAIVRKIFLTPLVVAILLLLSACTTPLSYNPQYQGRLRPIPGAQAEGRIVILTSPADDSYVFTGNPTSFTGGATKISIPLGLITKEISHNAFVRILKDGSLQLNAIPTDLPYRVIVKPRISSFSYAYNQLQNAGLLVTPQVNISLSIEVLDASQKVILTNRYQSGTKDGDSYFMSGSPGERINKLAHEVITELVNQAAEEVYYLISNQDS